MKSKIKFAKQPMHRLLFLYMLILVFVLLLFLAIGVFLADQFKTTKATVKENLAFQLNVFAQDIEESYEKTAMLGEKLSSSSTKIIETYLKNENITFNDINDSVEHIQALQLKLFDTLSQNLGKSDSSGCFIIFDATVNSTTLNASTSRSGLYLKRATTDKTDESITLFRGDPKIASELNLRKHPKWHLEYDTTLLNDYDEVINNASTEKKCLITDVFTLRDTSERVIVFMLPLIGSENEVYGVCGFELSEGQFKATYEQASQLDYLTFVFTKNHKELDYIKMDLSFFVGVRKGNDLVPKGNLSKSKFGKSLTELTGPNSFISYIKKLSLHEENSHEIAVLMPITEYNEMKTNNVLKVVSLVTLLVTLTGSLCFIFSRHYLSPILKGLSIIKQQKHKDATTHIKEIDDLFSHLSKNDQRNEEEIEALLKEIDDTLLKLHETKTKVERLSYSRKSEIDPDDLEYFTYSINILTKTEKQIYDYYIEGKSKDEIMKILDIKASTLKFHTHNILDKLGVKNLKEMLRFVALLNDKTQ